MNSIGLTCSDVQQSVDVQSYGICILAVLNHEVYLKQSLLVNIDLQIMGNSQDWISILWTSMTSVKCTRTPFKELMIIFLSCYCLKTCEYFFFILSHYF